MPPGSSNDCSDFFLVSTSISTSSTSSSPELTVARTGRTTPIETCTCLLLAVDRAEKQALFVEESRRAVKPIIAAIECVWAVVFGLSWLLCGSKFNCLPARLEEKETACWDKDTNELYTGDGSVNVNGDPILKQGTGRQVHL